MKNRNTGTGANANPKADIMQLVGSDTLAELVWSPGTGLNIKFAEEKPRFMSEFGPGEMELFNSQNEEHNALLSTCHMSEKVGSCTVTYPVGSDTKGAGDRLTDGGEEGPGYESRPPLRINPMRQCRPHKPVERTDIEADNVNMEKDGCFSDPFLQNAQDAIFENKTAERHQVGSHESMESEKSANFLTERKRKCSFERQLILRGKRIKNQTDGSSFINWTSNTLKGLKKHNMCDPRVSVCDETCSLDQAKHVGFHNVFQSLLSPETVKQLQKSSIGSLKEKNLAKKCSHGSLSYLAIRNEETDNHAKHISLYERVTKETPKDMFDTIRKLQLSRTDILKLMTSQPSDTHLDGFFLRLRVAKWEEEAGGSRYYVACITGSKEETPWKDLKQSIRVKVGDVECLVQSQYVSNCNFQMDELIAWWQKTSQTRGIPVVKDLKSKLAERRSLGV